MGSDGGGEGIFDTGEIVYGGGEDISETGGVFVFIGCPRIGKERDYVRGVRYYRYEIGIGKK